MLDVLTRCGCVFCRRCSFDKDGVRQVALGLGAGGSGRLPGTGGILTQPGGPERLQSLGEVSHAPSLYTYILLILSLSPSLVHRSFSLSFL